MPQIAGTLAIPCIHAHIQVCETPPKTIKSYCHNSGIKEWGITSIFTLTDGLQFRWSCCLTSVESPLCPSAQLE